MFARHTIRAARPICIRYTSSTTATSTTPSLLTKVRTDLKTAMKDKDVARLAVLRSLLAQALNASKTPHPITNNMQFLALVRKNISASKAAALEFTQNQRGDLAEKEEARIRHLEGFTGQMEVLGESKVREAIAIVLEGMEGGEKGNVRLGDVIKGVLARVGEGNIDRAELARIVTEVVTQRASGNVG